MRLSWDEAKDRANRMKHGVSFRQASELFTSNADFLEIFDDAHSGDEDRFIAIGPIREGVVLVVWTEQDDETIRIISARWATKRERGLYDHYMERYR